MSQLPAWYLFSCREIPDILAVERKVAAATQKIVLNALPFLYSEFIDQPLNNKSSFQRVRCQQKILVVLTRAEVAKLLSIYRAQLY